MNDHEYLSSENQGPLTEWVNEPGVATLKEDLKVAEPLRNAQVEKVRNRLAVRNVEGKHRPKERKGRSKAQPKLVRRQNEWRYPALCEPFLSADEMIKVNPRTFEDKAAAVQNQLIINQQFDTVLDRQRLIDEIVRVTVDEGTCVLRTGWERETEEVVVKKPTFQMWPLANEQEAQTLKQAIMLMQQNPNEFRNLSPELQEAAEYTLETGTPAVAKIIGYEDVVEERIVKNRPTITTVNYDAIYIDPSCDGDVDKANFAIYMFETSKAELIKDGRYSNLDLVNWSGASSTMDVADSDLMDSSTPAFQDDLRKRVVAYEYWGFYDVNGDEKLVPIVATWIGDVMIRMEENPYPDQKLPFIFIPYMPVKKSVYGEADAELLEDNQAIQGALLRGMIDLMGRSANAQTAFHKGALDPINKRKMENGEDYEVNTTGMHASQIMHQHKYPEIPNSALTMFGLQNQDAEALTGVKSFSGGLSSDAFGDVAAGIRGILDAASKREMNILRRVANGVAKASRKVMIMNQAFLSEEEVVRVTNEEFVSVRREELAGEFDLKCEIVTAEVKEAKAQELAFLLQTLGPNAEFGMVRLVLVEIARLRGMPELAKMLEQYEPQPDPFTEQMKQIELQMKQLELQELQSKIMLNRAKAAGEAANTDQKNLDFVEQESGTKHARDLQKQEAQAKGNADLKITEALLNMNGEDRNTPNEIRNALTFSNLQSSLT